MNGVSLMEMLLNLIFYALDTAVVMDDMIDSILKLALCGCYILVQVSGLHHQQGRLEEWVRFDELGKICPFKYLWLN